MRLIKVEDQTDTGFVACFLVDRTDADGLMEDVRKTPKLTTAHFALMREGRYIPKECMITDVSLEVSPEIAPFYTAKVKFIVPRFPHIVNLKEDIWLKVGYLGPFDDMVAPELKPLEIDESQHLMATPPSTNEEHEEMSFNRSNKLPKNVADCDVSRLHNSQLLVMADMLGARAEVDRCDSREGRNSVLKLAITSNPDRAQRFYEIICLQKEPGAAPAGKEEERYVELLTAVLNKYSEGLDGSAAKIIDKVAAQVGKQGDKLLDQLSDFAKQAVREAAEKRAPFIVKSRAEVRKVKGVLPPEFQRMVELASARIPIMLVGPAGCGKTYLAEKLGEALGLEVSDQSCSEGMSESVFNGRLLPIGERGAFDHVPSPFMQRYETGGVMLLDEIDAGDPNLFTYINKAVANSSYTVEQRWKKPRVKKHPDFVLVAAANTFGHGADAMYVGRNQLDAATLDRFKVGLITMDYSKEVEESLAPSDLLKWAWGIRDKIRESKIRRIMSTRVVKDLAAMTEMYKWTREQWERSYFAGWSESERKLVQEAA